MLLSRANCISHFISSKAVAWRSDILDPEKT
uniref:Uncharacterized protein n=1 Tax=Tetranychus urticae TaxID=32264 RepID=T1JSS1_TETUR